MPTAVPLIMNSLVTVDTTDLTCLTGSVAVEPDNATTEVKTMCGTTEYPSTTKWTFTATFIQSFDVGATHDTLWTIVEAGVPVTVTILPNKDKPQGPDNPLITVEAIPSWYAPISGEAGEVSEVEIEWQCTGPPTIDPSTLPLTQSASAAA